MESATVGLVENISIWLSDQNCVTHVVSDNEQAYLVSYNNDSIMNRKSHFAQLTIQINTLKSTARHIFSIIGKKLDSYMQRTLFRPTVPEFINHK